MIYLTTKPQRETAKMKKLLSVAVAGMLTVMAGSAYADNLKVGVVDMNQILQKSPLMISLNDDLNKKFKSRQDEINNAQKQLQDEAYQLNSSTTMTTDDRSKLQSKIINDKANVDVMNTQFQRDLAIAKDQASQKFMTKLADVINKVAKDGKYDIIEQRTNLLYINSGLDITQDVLRQVS
jgi:outer membrane protein